KGRGGNAFARLRVILIADRAGETRPQAGRHDLPPPIRLQPGACDTNGGRNRLLRALDFGGHVLAQIALNGGHDASVHGSSGRTSADQIRRSSSRRGSPCTMYRSPSISKESPLSSAGTWAILTSRKRAADTKRPDPKFVTVSGARQTMRTGTGAPPPPARQSASRPMFGSAKSVSIALAIAFMAIRPRER